MNTGKIRIAFIETCEDIPLTEAQMRAALDLTLYLNDEYGIDEIYGHRDLNPTESPICPGNQAMIFVNQLKEMWSNR